MKLSTILLSTCLAIILLCDSCTAELSYNHPLRACAEAILEGNEQKCFSLFIQGLMENQEWSEDEPRTSCENECAVNRRGYFMNFQWVWEARYRCDSVAPGIIGSAKKKSRNGATLWALDDFIKKAVATGRFKEEQFRCGKPKN